MMTSAINLKTITTFVAVCGLVFSVIKFIQIKEIEAAKPYLEMKLKWCEEAVETASAIANSKNYPTEQWRRFRELYWGVMGLVEKQDIYEAMVDFEKGPEKETVEEKSLALAHACRAELANDWSSSWSR